MEKMLGDVEVRVLGSLIEKELTTPEYYPLSLNALTNACNQKSNRDPVMALAEEDVVRAVDSLRFKQFVVLSADSGRVSKYRHLLAEKLGLMQAELAVVCELLVRGPQTIGELRTRGERMHPFGDLGAVEEVLDELIQREKPMITLLPKQPGRKEGRYAQLFSAVPAYRENTEAPQEAARQRVSAVDERILILEEEVRALREEIAGLHKGIAEFKAQFE
ncbi:MAG: YceH family protein [Desulfuromonadaceae bacterium]|nr:YceH family protein [Desulfuromonadaceae bacterium]MDD5104712.1 YceH family protein [Desulfuromonadaceae bacterium]